MGISFYIVQLGEVWFACICDRSGAKSCNCVFNLAGLLQKFQVPSICNTGNYLLCFSKTQPPSQLHFSLPSIITTITSNEPWNTGTHKTDRKFTNHQSQAMTFWTCWSKFLFPERSTKMIDGSENANVSWLLNFGIHMFLKSAAIGSVLNSWFYFFLVSSQSSQAYAHRSDRKSLVPCP